MLDLLCALLWIREPTTCRAYCWRLVLLFVAGFWLAVFLSACTPATVGAVSGVVGAIIARPISEPARVVVTCETSERAKPASRKRRR